MPRIAIKNNDIIRGSIDVKADVLYLSIGESCLDEGLDYKDGIILRYNSNNIICGATVINYKWHKSQGLDNLATKLSERFPYRKNIILEYINKIDTRS